MESIIRKYNARLTVMGPLRVSRSGNWLREENSDPAGEWGYGEDEEEEGFWLTEIDEGIGAETSRKPK